MSEKSGNAERDARNRGLQEEEKRLHDQEGRPPHGDIETDASAPKRPTTSAEDNAEDIGKLENPPQTDGPRERNNDAV